MSPSHTPLPQSDDDREDEISVDLAVDSYSEEEGNDDGSRREWLSHHSTQSPTPMDVEVARPVARTAAVPPRDKANRLVGRDRVLRTIPKPGAIGTRSTAFTASSTLWPYRPLPPAPAAVESCGHALAAMSQA